MDLFSPKPEKGILISVVEQRRDNGELGQLVGFELVTKKMNMDVFTYSNSTSR
jgi:hypothetical protein